MTNRDSHRIKPIQITLKILWIGIIFFLPQLPSASSVSYFYDDLGRLIQEVRGTKVINYSYDDVGNRLVKEVLTSDTGITLIAPNGGEHWRPGATETISWTYGEEAGDSVKIELLKGGVPQSTISAGTSVGSNGKGTYAWPIPVSQETGTDYTIRMTSVTDADVTDSSRGNFIINSLPVITVSGPKAGGVWAVGTALTISWNYSGDPPSTVRIELLREGVVETVLAKDAPLGSGGKGSLAWTIPAGQAPGSGYRIRLTSPVGGAQGVSGIFSISGGITLTYPSAGNVEVQAGSTQQITWGYTGTPGSTVKIELLKGTAVDFVLTENAPAGTGGVGSYSWTVPAGQAGGSDYRIRVTSTSEGTYTDTSDHVFSINPTTISVSSPYRGQVWYGGEAQSIAWTYAGDPGSTVKIELLKGAVVDSVISESTAAGTRGTGSYSWTISEAQPSGRDYKIRVTSTAHSNASGTSAGAFTIKPPRITINNPNGNESWMPGELMEISWAYLGNPGERVKIELLKGATLQTVITANSPIGIDGWGSYSWTIPAGQAEGKDYRVRISSTTNSAYTDISNQYFSVTGSPIHVDKPNGGELQAGSTYTIMWNYIIEVGASVRIELIQGTTVHSVIAPSVPLGSNGTGTYNWEIPATLAGGNDYKVRVTSTSNPAFTDESEFAFTIVPVGLTVTSPNNWEVWPRGQTHNITWEYHGKIGSSVRLELLDNGVLKSTIASFAPSGSLGAGSYSWAIPSTITPGGGYTVRVTSTGNSAYTDTSSYPFTIGPTLVTVESPKGRATLQAGNVAAITWRYTGSPGTAVKIELLKGTAVDSVITESVPVGGAGSGSYSWTIPQAQGAGSDYRIRVTSTTDSSYSDTTNAPFTILPVISVISPNGGESLAAGKMRTIRWGYGGNPGAFAKIELLKGDEVHSTMAASASMGSGGQGSFDWTIPAAQVGGSDYRVRVTSKDNSACTDTSNAAFAITPTVLTVSSPDGGDNLQAGKSSTISWQYTGNPGPTVKIELLKGSAVQSVLSSDRSIGGGGRGSFSWAIPANLAGGSDYRIRITSTTDTAFSDVSNSPFTIKPSSIDVTEPDGGETLQAGIATTIRWTYAGNPGSTVKIELLKDTVVESTIADAVSIGKSGSGAYKWAIPAAQLSGSDYRVRVTSTDNLAYTSISGSALTILPTRIEVQSPSYAGESLQAGSQYTIHWNYYGTPGSSVKIQLIQGTEVKATIAASVGIGSGGRGSYNWSLPGGQPAGSNYKFRINSTSDNVYTDDSDRVFKINPSSLTVTSPSSSKPIRAGRVCDISWRYVGDPGATLQIDLFKDTDYQFTIAKGVNRGSSGVATYGWNAPVRLAGGDDYHIRLTGSNNTSVMSKAITVNPTGLRLTRPSGGATWTQGKAVSVCWSYTGNPGVAVRIELRKGGVLNRVIAAAAPLGSDGSECYAWTVPSTQAIGSNYRLKILSKQDSAYTDTSDADFRIVAP